MNLLVHMWLFLLITFFQDVSTRRDLQNSEIVEILLSNHSTLVPPHFDIGGTVQVECNIQINSIDSISESSMDYQMSMFLRQKWHDPRLAYREHVSLDEDAEEMILLEPPISDLIWIPDLIFSNEKNSHYHVVTTPNKFIRIFSNGTAFYSSRITVTLSCSMVLHKFPIDTQICYMQITSYAYTRDYMTFKWRFQSPVEVSDDLELPQFLLEEHSTRGCSLEYSTGNYSCIEAEFVLRRDVAFFMILSYIPSALLVGLSWINFWLSMDAIPARITLGVLTLLTITSQTVGSNEDMPPVNYIKAIDVWNVTCMTFIFAALLEFAVVNVISRRSVPRIIHDNVKEIHTISSTITAISMGGLRKRQDDSDQFNNVRTSSDSNGTDTRSQPSPVNPMYTPDPKARQRAKRVDIISRVAFPVCFLLFNILYWLVYKYSLWGLVTFV